MDDELRQLESELKQLRPVAPSPDLQRRLARELAPAVPARKRSNPSWLWVLAPAAAAAVTFLLLRAPRPDQEPRAASSAPGAAVGAAAEAAGLLKPVAVENTLYSAEDEGLVTLEDGTPARRERLNYVDTITWRNPRTNASLTWRVPREEVRVVPVLFQ